MDKYVYLARSHGDIMEKLLEENGFTSHTGNGTLDPEILAECEVLMPGGKVTVDAAVLDQAPHLRLVAKSGVGYDRIDVEECTRRGIYVANTPMTNFVSVAEHTIALMLAAAKKIYPISLYLRHEYPDFWCRERYEGTELYGKTLCVVGLGNIGRRVAKLAEAFEMKLVGYDPFANPATLPETIQVYQELDEALSVADFVTLHVAGGPATYHMMNEHAFDCMKSSAILINVARGTVVDQEALAEALRTGKIAGAGLDVFEEEPLQPHNPLMLMENVVATPHCAGNTDDARVRTQYGCLDNIMDLYAGKKPRFALNDIKC